MTRLNRDWIAGAMLVLVGVLLLGDRLFPEFVPFAPLVLGLGLLLLFLLTRSSGALVAGGVITGIGLGILVATRGSADVGAAGFLISLALGFFLVWGLGLLFEVRDVRVWPVVPGSLLLAAGAVVYTAGLGKTLLELTVQWWPAVLILMGAYLLLAARFRGRLTPEDDETSQVAAVSKPVAPAHAPAPTPPRAPDGAHHPDNLRATSVGGDRPGSVEQS